MNPIVKNGNKIRCEFKNVKSLTENLMFGNKTSIEDIDCNILINTKSGNVKWLSVYFYQGSDKNERNNDKNWLREVDVRFKLLSQAGKGKNLMKEAKMCFKHDLNNWGHHQFIEWDKLLSEDNGYLIDDSFVVEVEFDFKYYDFSKKIPNVTDIVITTEETEFHANKGVLCSNSKYFYDLFADKKGEDSVIKLDDIKASELCYILASTNFSFNGVPHSKFGEIIKIAENFGVSSLHHACEKFLIKYKGMELIDKIIHFEVYGYEELMKSCIESLNTGDDIKNLHGNLKFSALKETTKLRIMQRFLDIY